jgi:uncharacterized protein (DUF58 family)
MTWAADPSGQSTQPAPTRSAPSPLPNPWRHPWRHLRARWERFWIERLTPRDTLLLTQRTVYILPTAAGWMLGATLLVLLVASINYQLNLGYVLTFLVAGSALVGMHLSHGTLRGLSLQMETPAPAHADSAAVLQVRLGSEARRVRHGIGVAMLGAGHWSWTDVPAQGSATVQVSFRPERRGLLPIPPITAETRFPLGTFRVWTVWRPAARVLVYPAVEAHPPPLPPAQAREGTLRAAARPAATGEYDGVRAYRRGDPLKLVVWKKMAKADELVSRDSEQAQQSELWLDLGHTGVAGASAGGAALEQALSRLCAWVLAADRLGLAYGLRLGTLAIPAASGDAHRRRCLETLALHGTQEAAPVAPTAMPTAARAAKVSP